MLIVISGIDGSGKTLQVQMLKNWYTEHEVPASAIKAYDEHAKNICRPFINSWMDETAIMFLFQALHAEQYAQTIAALKKGEVVIADRWDESYLAYHQSFGELAHEPALRQKINELAFRGRLPDVGFLIDIPPHIARSRRTSRGSMERFENRPDEYYQVIQSSYRAIAIERKWCILDGTKTPLEIHHSITSVLSGHSRAC